MVDGGIIDASPGPHGDLVLVSLPFSFAFEDKFSKGDSFEDLFATKDDFHGYAFSS